MSHGCTPAQQQRVDVLHQRSERSADVVVPTTQSAAAMLKRSVAIFIVTVGRLDHAVAT
jgi:hypothetical protein